jgi:hypothetical protein
MAKTDSFHQMRSYIHIYIRMFIDIQICDIELYTSWSEGDGGKDTYVYIYTYTCICYRYVVILKFWSRLWISQSHYHFDSLLFDISTFFLLQHDCLCTYIYIYLSVNCAYRPWGVHPAEHGYKTLQKNQNYWTNEQGKRYFRGLVINSATCLFNQ